MQGYIRNEDALLYYEVHGDRQKAALLLLHGNGEDHTYFRSLLPFLQKKFCVLLMDTRGHGRSSWGRRRLTFSLFARDVHALLVQLRLSSVHVFGFSDGGNIAMELALHCPGLVRSLLLNGANAHPFGMTWKTQREIWREYGRLWRASYQHSSAIKKRKICALMLYQPWIFPHRLRSLAIPSLVLTGSCDMIRRAHSRSIAAMLHAPYVELEGSHFIVLEKPKEVAEIIEAFLHHVESEEKHEKCKGSML